MKLIVNSSPSSSQGSPKICPSCEQIFIGLSCHLRNSYIPKLALHWALQNLLLKTNSYSLPFFWGFLCVAIEGFSCLLRSIFKFTWMDVLEDPICIGAVFFQNKCLGWLPFELLICICALSQDDHLTSSYILDLLLWWHVDECKRVKRRVVAVKLGFGGQGTPPCQRPQQCQNPPPPPAFPNNPHYVLNIFTSL